MVSQGLQCVKSSVSSTTNLYTQALLAYTFSLAGNMNIRNILLEKLDQLEKQRKDLEEREMLLKAAKVRSCVIYE